MSNQGVAYRYAKPLFELAEEQNVLDAINQDMQLFSQVNRENFEFQVVLKNPVIRGHKKMSILKSMFDGKVHALTMSIFDLMSRKNRIDILLSTSEAFTKLYNEKNNIEEAEAITAAALDEAQIKRLKESLEKQTGKKIILTTKTDSNLIGGMVLKLGGNILDTSVKNGLQKLKLQFLNN